MRRYGLAFAGICVVLLFAYIYLLAQHQTPPAIGLVLQQKFQDHKYAVYTADFDDNEELVASGGADGLRVWRVDDAREVYHQPGRIHLVRFLNDGTLLCADADKGILLLDPKTWQVRRTFGHKANRIVGAVTDAGDRIAASFSVAEKNDTAPPMSFEIHVWQLVDKEWRESILRGHKGPVNALAFHPHARQLVSFGEDLTTRVWDLSSAKQIDQIGEGSPGITHRIPMFHAACAFSPSGDRLLANGSTWDYAKDDEKPIRESTAKKLAGQNAMFSPMGAGSRQGFPMARSICGMQRP